MGSAPPQALELLRRWTAEASGLEGRTRSGRASSKSSFDRLTTGYASFLGSLASVLDGTRRCRESPGAGAPRHASVACPRSFDGCLRTAGCTARPQRALVAALRRRARTRPGASGTRQTQRDFGHATLERLAAQEVAEVRHREGDRASLGRIDQALLDKAVSGGRQRRRLPGQRVCDLSAGHRTVTK
jgi:hypothetical protein